MYLLINFYKNLPPSIEASISFSVVIFYTYFSLKHTSKKMSTTCNPFFELPDHQLCYVQCSLCNTILLVSVPCNSLAKMVTVLCGHCTDLFSVDMMRASFIPIKLLALLGDEEQKQEQLETELPKSDDGSSPHMINGDEKEEDMVLSMTPIVNKPPEKRQRAPSTYNLFIKEEIQRIKAMHPDISHKEAFSTAAKNWAHFPRIQNKGNEESCSQRGGKGGNNGWRC
ncbi:Axial regulator YABBY 4 [Acorus gramineus]|uniref:Axial regulator YABBY 4 n=1 Tax=Acorus gramineus TaxID=55184 RepID=A0AAV9BSD8_ACOGR|nr:Axial regulator YABBY 4 [Acorus gramineus]